MVHFRRDVLNMIQKILCNRILACFFFLAFSLLFSCNSNGDEIVKGELEEENGNYGKAINLYEGALEKDPKNAYLYYKIGNLYDKKLSKKKKALDIYLQGIRYFPKDFGLNVNLMNLYFSMGKISEGIAQYRAIAKVKKDPEIFVFPRNSLHQLQKDLSEKEQIEFITELISINPSDKILREELANIFISRKETNKAIDQLESIIEFEKNDGRIYLALGMMYYQSDMYQKAYNSFLKAKELGANVPPQYVEYARKMSTN